MVPIVAFLYVVVAGASRNFFRRTPLSYESPTSHSAQKLTKRSSQLLLIIRFFCRRKLLVHVSAWPTVLNGIAV